MPLVLLLSFPLHLSSLLAFYAAFAALPATRAIVATFVFAVSLLIYSYFLSLVFANLRLKQIGLAQIKKGTTTTKAKVELFHLRSKYIKREGGRQRERHLFAVDGGVSCAAAASAADALIARAATAADLACDGGAFVSIDKQTNNRKNCRQLLSGVNISNGGVATSAVISRRQAGSAAAVAVVVDYQNTSKAA